jgi:V/A-type H+-transporting ATPase subunit C
MSVASQAYLNTRITAMSTGLLACEQLFALAQLSLPELAERCELQPLLDEQLPRRAKSRAVEQSLIRLLLAELAILTRPMAAPERGLVLAWGRKYALFNLKTLIRGKLYDLDQAEIQENLYDLPERDRLSRPRIVPRRERAGTVAHAGAGSAALDRAPGTRGL